jgi:Tol biopolymer transport system component
VSVDSSGAQGDGSSGGGHISISADGRSVAFRSFASNLVAGDTNGFLDVFVHDRETGVTTRVSVDSSGAQGNEESEMPSISADGRFVAFHSLGSNLVAGDTNGFFDVFLHDRETGVTSRMSVDSSGLQGDNGSYNPSISADGRFVAFESDATNFVAGDSNFTTDVFVYEQATGGTERVSVNSSGADGNDGSILPAISAHGGLVAFESFASNLVAGDTNRSPDVFVHGGGGGGGGGGGAGGGTPPPAQCTITGTNRADTLVGTADDDVICAKAGGDTLRGKAGDDVEKGGKGRDLLKGGPGADVLNGGPGFDTCKGGKGPDTLKNCEA